MTKEKTTLIKTLKDENLRAETHKYTQNLLNNNKQRSLTVPNNNTNIINKIEKNEIKETNEIIIKNDEILNKKEKETNTEIKKKKKVKKKIKLKKVDKLEKTDKIEKTEKNENGQKYKLLTYKTINEIKFIFFYYLNIYFHELQFPLNYQNYISNYLMNLISLFLNYYFFH